MSLLAFFYLVLLIVIIFNFFVDQLNWGLVMNILIIVMVCTLMGWRILSKIGIACPGIWYEIISFKTSLIKKLPFESWSIWSVNHKRVFFCFRNFSSLWSYLLLVEYIYVLVVSLLLLNEAFNIVYLFILKLSCVTFLSLRIILNIRCSFTSLECCIFIVFYVLTIIRLKGPIQRSKK